MIIQYMNVLGKQDTDFKNASWVCWGSALQVTIFLDSAVPE